MCMLIWALLEYPWCVLGRDVSPTEDIDAGMFPFAARMASIRPILFSGLFCLVLLSRINRERLIHFSRKTGYSKIRQVTMNEAGVLTHNNIYKGTKQHARQTPPWYGGPSPSPGLPSPWPTRFFLWISVSSDGKSGNNAMKQAHCEQLRALSNWPLQ